MKNFRGNKNNIIIGLCAIVILMGIGFAAFSQRLEIGDTTVTNSDWNVYIKSAVAGTSVGGATGSAQVVDRATAKLTANLTSPGDSVTYTITVANDGNIDAVLDLITLSASNSDSVIKYSYSGIVEDEELTAKTEKSFTVKIEYDSTKTGTVTEAQKQNTLTLDLDYVQKGNEMTNPAVPTTQTVYRWTEDKLTIGDSIEGIETTTDPSTLVYNYYLKHDVENNLITASYVCFVTDSEYCLKGGDASYYQNNLEILRASESWFNNNEGWCSFDNLNSFSGDYSGCYDGTLNEYGHKLSVSIDKTSRYRIHVELFSDGSSYENLYCEVSNDNVSSCYSRPVG